MWNPFRRKPPRPLRYWADEEALWEERLAALEALYGKSHDTVLHAVVPFFLGYDAGGAADVVFFQSHIPGQLAVTADLIGCDDQKPNALGNYELAIAHCDGAENWRPELISLLAYSTLDEALEPGHTMEVRPSVPEGSTIEALMFFDYGSFLLRDHPCGVLLCVGLTRDETAACLAGRREEVEDALKTRAVFPYTDLTRESVV